MSRSAITALLVLPLFSSLISCGGGSGAQSSPTLPVGAPTTTAPQPTSNGTTPQPTGAPRTTNTPGETSPPIPTGTPVPTSPPVISGPSQIGVAHIFDSGITTATIAARPNRYNVIWASFDPAPWRLADPSALVSRYYIPEEDNTSISPGRDLRWWQHNRPDWILYACTPSGVLTHEIAYTPGVGFADVPLNIHDPAVVAYQQRQSLIPYVIAHNYNSIAIDQVLLSNVMEGGNPKLGQSIIPGYFGCGVWHGSTPEVIYRSSHDPKWTTDIVAWVQSLHTILKSDPAIAPHKISLIINHPANGISSTEASLLASTDADVNETGYSDYGLYVQPSRAILFGTTLRWTEYAQTHGVHVITVDKYTLSPLITSSQIDFALATYFMGNEGRSSLDIAGTSYSIQPYYAQFGTNLGDACGAVYGGASYDSSNAHIFYRRFSHGLVVVNSGSLPRGSETARLPSNHVYHDVMDRAVSNPLAVPSSDGFTLTTSGSGCN